MNVRNLLFSFDVDGGIAPAVLLHSGRGETSLLSEYTYQHCQLQPAALIKRIFSNRLLLHKLIDRLTCVQQVCPYMDTNLSGPCWTGQILIHLEW